MKNISAQATFMDGEHYSFYKSCLKKCGKDDVHHRALFYLLGLTEDTRTHIHQLYDFNERCIEFKGFNKEWQTSASILICRLAFNLYNAYAGEATEESAKEYTAFNLFCYGEFREYMFEAIRIRFS